MSVLGRRGQTSRMEDVASGRFPTLPYPELMNRQGMFVCIGARPTLPLARELSGSAGLHRHRA